jgi:hypothetical protein
MNTIGSDGTPTSTRLGTGSWILIAVLVSVLIATVIAAYFGWNLGSAEVPTAGYVAMAFGVIFSLLVGFGLMALVFYSSRSGYDEPPVVITPEDVPDENVVPAGSERLFPPARENGDRLK